MTPPPGPGWRSTTRTAATITAAGLALILGGEAPEAVVDAIWALASPEVYVYLTEGRGWSMEAAEDWLVDICGATIAKYRAA